MSSRKSIHRKSSRYSIQSQVSGVLDPNSNIASDEESQANWFNEFENNSVNIRPSARFSLAQNDSAVLDSNSELESTPLQKSWWKNIENTPDVRFTDNNVSGERSNVQERSNLETSEASLLDEGVAKRRFPLPRKKRKSHQRNVFSEILDASRDSIASEKIIRNPESEERQKTIDSSSDTDESVQKMKKQLFKNRKRNKLAKKSKADESLPKAFQRALDASQSVDETLGEPVASNEPGNSIGNRDESNPDSPTSGESMKLVLEHLSPSKERLVSEEPKETSPEDQDLERSRSPVMTSRLKKRTIFTKTTKRRTANFDELLNNLSEESLADRSSIRGELESNRDERREETIAQPSRKSDSARDISDQTDETDSEESVKKQRVPFGRKKRQSHQEKTFPQLLESPNISIHSEPANTSQQSRNSELSRHKTPWSDVERRSSKRKSSIAESPVPSNFQLEGNRSARKSRRLSNSPNVSGFASRSIHETRDQADISGSANAELEDNRSITTQIEPASIRNKSSAASLRQSMSEKSIRAGTAGDSNIELEEHHSVRTRSRLSSVGNESGTERHSTNKRANESAESSGFSNAELEQNRSISTLIYPSRIEDESGSERRTENEEKDRVGTSRSGIVEEEANRRSSVFKKPQDLSKNKKSLNQSQVNKSRSSTRSNYASFEAHNRSRSAELPGSTDEEEDEGEISENLEDLPNTTDVIGETQQNRNYSNNSRLPLRDASSAENAEVTIPLETADKYVDQRKTTSSKKSRSTAQNLQKTVGSLQKRNLTVANKTNGSYTADGLENTEILEPRLPDVGETTQSVTNGTQRSFSSIDHNGTGSVQPTNESLGIGSQVSHAEKLSQLKSALEKIKGQEIVLKKTATIDSYFKKISPNKPAKDFPAKASQKAPSRKKPVVNESKTTSVSPNKAYIVNGKVYKRPKLPRPKSWVTDRLYNYLWKKMEAKFQLRTRVRSEQFVVNLSQVVAVIVRRQKYDNYKHELNNLIHEMARLGIIETRNDFNIFCQKFLPYEFRIKVIPMLLPGDVRNIPFYPEELHTPILKL